MGCFFKALKYFAARLFGTRNFSSKLKANCKNIILIYILSFAGPIHLMNSRNTYIDRNLFINYKKECFWRNGSVVIKLYKAILYYILQFQRVDLRLRLLSRK